MFSTPVYCSHVLEHIPNPVKALKEMIRVTKKVVIIKVPHILSEAAKQNSSLPFNKHLHVFRRKWFAKVLKNYRFKVTVNYKPFLLFLSRPYEIEVTIIKNGEKW